jgi:hypothetical protein
MHRRGYLQEAARMNNATVAFAVLSALFGVYVIAATWRSRSVGPRARQDRRAPTGNALGTPRAVRPRFTKYRLAKRKHEGVESGAGERGA